MKAGIPSFDPPTTYRAALEMVRPLAPDGDATLYDQYVAWDRLKLFLRLLLPDE